MASCRTCVCVYMCICAYVHVCVWGCIPVHTFEPVLSPTQVVT